MNVSIATGCLLCGRKPILIGSFIPHNQRAINAPAGKVRAVWYSLCRRCSKKRSTPAKIEDFAFRSWAAMERVN
jgi:hypothetical protein